MQHNTKKVHLFNNNLKNNRKYEKCHYVAHGTGADGSCCECLEQDPAKSNEEGVQDKDEAI